MYHQQTSQNKLKPYQCTVHIIINIYLPKDGDQRQLFERNRACKVENSTLQCQLFQVSTQTLEKTIVGLGFSTFFLSCGFIGLSVTFVPAENVVIETSESSKNFPYL